MTGTTEVKYPSWCQHCCISFHPVMLTGYCITACRCDQCGRVSDLAIVTVRDGAK